MRKDILERMRVLKQDDIEVNYAELARQYGCDYRTVKRYFEGNLDEIGKREPKPSILDPYKTIIEDKLQIGCSASAIYRFIMKRGYKGCYSVVKRYCNKYKVDQFHKATIRYETNPGLQAQVDWKESKIIKNKNGKQFIVNIFLVILGYSRMKYIELTLDRTQSTVFQALVNSFKYYGGIPKEILFDNMKTVVDHAKSEYNKPVINSNFYEFSKDMGFQTILCRAFRPQTKGKVENLAKIMDRLDAYNNEFETIDELDEIIRELNIDLNNETSQATGETPIERFKKEKEYLNPLPRIDVLEGYITKPVTRKVTKESMIVYNKSKYSVSTKYIGKTVTLETKANTLYIYYNKELIKTHNISDKHLNYHKDDMVEILKSDVFKSKDDKYIEDFIETNLKIYDSLGGKL
jgi:transposase